ncbi:MAG: SLC13 family permease [Bacillaceae bacterium]
MTTEMMIAFIVLIVATGLFVFSRMRADFVALCCLVVLVLTDILSVKEAFLGFSNSAVIMIAALFIVGAGIFQTGLAQTVSQKLMVYAGKKEHSIILVTMLVSAVLSAFMSNTGTVAILLPVMISLSREANISVGKLLIPLSFASSLGGSMTLIGTPPNLMVSDKLAEVNLKSFSFFSFTPVGIILLGLGILFMLIVGRRLLPAGDDQSRNDILLLKKWGQTFKVDNKIHLLRVTKEASINGKTIHELHWATEYGIQVLEIKRETKNILAEDIHEVAAEDMAFQPNDILHIQGKKSEIMRLAKTEQLELVKGDKDSLLINEAFGVVEFLLTPDSALKGSNLAQLNFRRKYGLNVLSIIKNGKVYHEQLHNVRLGEGDALLLHGKWEDIEKFAVHREYGICLQLPPEERMKISVPKMIIAGMIIIAMLITLVFELIDPVLATVIAAMMMIVTRCIDGTKKIYGLIDWESLVLIAAMLPLSTALEKTGAVQYLADKIVFFFGDNGPLMVLAAIYILTNLFSQFMSNTATAVLFAPIAITAATSLDVSPYPLLMTVAVAASMAFSTPVASPTNAMVMTMGGYKFNDYLKVGIPLQLVVGIIAIIIIPFFFKF